MAFNGSLAEMSLDGVLQLIQFQQSTGVFTLKRAGVIAKVVFHQGYLNEIQIESSFWENKVKRFFELLEIPINEENFIKEDLLKNFKEAARENLLDQKMCLKAMKFFQTEIFCWFFSWRKGEYCFLNSSDRGVGVVQMAVEPLILEAMRRMDEAPSYEQQFSSRAKIQLKEEVAMSIQRPHDLVDPIAKPYFHLAFLLKDSHDLKSLEKHSFLTGFQILQCLGRFKNKNWLNVEVRDQVAWEPPEKHSSALVFYSVWILGGMFFLMAAQKLSVFLLE